MELHACRGRLAGATQGKNLAVSFRGERGYFWQFCGLTTGVIRGHQRRTLAVYVYCQVRLIGEISLVDICFQALI